MHVGMGDDPFHGVERVIRRDVHIGHEPLHAAKLASADVGTPLFQMLKLRMAE